MVAVEAGDVGVCRATVAHYTVQRVDFLHVTVSAAKVKPVEVVFGNRANSAVVVSPDNPNSALPIVGIS